MDALITATASRPYNAFKPQAYEMDLVLASRAKYSFDKILLLMHHGEDESQTTSSSTNIQDPMLTGEGFAQALSLSRKTAAYCNPQAGLEPQLVVVSPFSRVLQTTLLAFPYSTPGASSASIIGKKNTPWVCHPALVDASGDVSNHPMDISDLQLTVPGMDYSLYTDDDDDNDDFMTSTTSTTSADSQMMTLLESKEQLLHQADQFTRWLQGRSERVVVGKSME